jgi:hypothetical protein
VTDPEDTVDDEVGDRFNGFLSEAFPAKGDLFSWHTHGSLESSDSLAVLIGWDTSGDRAEPVSVTISGGRAAVELVPITSDMIRRLPFGSLVKQARSAAVPKEGGEWLRFAISLDGSPPEPEDFSKGDAFLRRVEELRPSLAAGSRRGSSLDEEVLGDVAHVYRQAWRAGMPVTATVAEAFHIAKSTAAKRIMKARAAGLLDDIQPTNKGAGR